MNLEQFLVSEIFTFLMIFCRVGSGIMLLPGFGEAYVPMRIRLCIALAISALMVPVISPIMPTVPGSPLTLTVFIIAEITVGLLIGSISRILISTMHTAGLIIAFQTGLASALAFDMNQSSQGAAIGNLLSVLAVVLIFSTDLHHLMLRGLADSYTLFGPGNFPPIGDFANLAAQLMSKSFLIAVKISSPLLVVGLLLYLGGGILSRLMPTIQIFFIITAPQILLGFFIVMTTLSAMMLWYLTYFQETLAGFLSPS